MILQVGLGTGCAIDSSARVPKPNILPIKKGVGSFKVDTSSVPEAEVCSVQGGLRDFCVAHFRTAIGGGLDKVLSQYIDGSKPGSSYRGTFKLVEFSHSITSSGAGGGSVKVTLRWQFRLLDGAGQPVVQLAETTDGPEQLNVVDSADKAILALLNAVMERIAASMTAAEWPEEAALKFPQRRGQFYYAAADAISHLNSYSIGLA